MKLNIQYLHPDAKTPTYATDGAGCFDLYAATRQGTLFHNGDKDYGAKQFGTGLAFEIPQGHVMMVFSRSGHGFKDGATLVNSVGIIDSDYRGEVKVKFNNPIHAVKGDRIAQALIIPISQVEFDVVEQLSATARGDGGFGSTGV